MLHKKSSDPMIEVIPEKKIEIKKAGGTIKCGCGGGTLKEEGGVVDYTQGGKMEYDRSEGEEKEASKEIKSSVVDKLNEILANYQIFYQNLRSLHWNIEGVTFFELHSKYEELYDEVGDRLDNVAERILALKGNPIDTFSEYIKISDVKEITKITDGIKGVNVVISNFETILEKENEGVMLAMEQHDKATCYGLTKSIRCIDKHLWMLNSYVK